MVGWIGGELSCITKVGSGRDLDNLTGGRESRRTEQDFNLSVEGIR